MKLFAYTTFGLMALMSAHGYAASRYQPNDAATQTRVSIPSSQQQSPFDFNHMGAGSDKSDELGVPYYNASAR